jgi:uncharacterized membrane protein YbjE (DUF340 family)
MLMAIFGMIMLAGILAGAWLPWIPRESRFRNNVQYVFLFTLLFVLGHQLGSDDSVVASISQMGFLGVILAAAGMLGSFLLVLFLRLQFEKARKDAVDD